MACFETPFKKLQEPAAITSLKKDEKRQILNFKVKFDAMIKFFDTLASSEFSRKLLFNFVKLKFTKEKKKLSHKLIKQFTEAFKSSAHMCVPFSNI